MKKKKPSELTPEEIQMTPVSFSPSPEMGAVGPTSIARRGDFQFPLFIPLFLVFATLIFADLRDISAMNKRVSEMGVENMPAQEMLRKASKTVAFRDSLKDGLSALAPTDPVAAQILKEYFGPSVPQKAGFLDSGK